MERYSNYTTGMVPNSPYKHLQNKTTIFSQMNHRSYPSRRMSRKSIMPYSNYISPSTHHSSSSMYYAPHSSILPPTQPPPIRPIPVTPVERMRRMRTSPQQHPQYSPQPPQVIRNSSTSRSEIPPLKRYNFSGKDIDAVLYGYLSDENNGDKTPAIKGNSYDSINQNNDENVNSERDLPENLEIQKFNVGYQNIHRGTFAKETIKKGSLFGPFEGITVPSRQLNKQNSEHCWEVFHEDGKLSHYISAYGCYGNWMKNVNCARYDKEQNLRIVQKGMDVYYEAIQEIKVGQELLVWYGENYTHHIGIPFALKDQDCSDIKENDRKFLGDITGTNAVAGSYPCNRCGKIFSYAYYREKHLKYTRCVDKGDRKFPCHLCQRSFEKKDRLRIHVLHVHQKYRPHVCNTCGKRFSQSSSLNKHSRVHTGERPYACPHCPKSFTASSILRTHLRQHNGERPFKCKFCGKAFASHAAHDSHVKRTHEKLKKFNCYVCPKTFSMEFELNFHLTTHTVIELETSKQKLDEFDQKLLIQQKRPRAFSEESDTLVVDIEDNSNDMDI